MSEMGMQTGATCENEACGRMAEADEAYCAACGLEQSLFRRETRREDAEKRSSRRREPARR